MKFSFSDDQKLFASSLSDLLANECPASRVREAWDDASGHAADVWTKLADTGVLGMLVPEADGGMGGNEIDLVLLLNELGRAGMPGPVLEHAAVVAPALAGTEWASGLADGSVVATVALDGPYMPHAQVADVALGAGGVVVLSDASLTDVDGIDLGRRLYSVRHGDAIAVDGFDVELARDRAAMASAAVLVGTARRLLDLAGEYARQREQFGKPIGSFQAVKHTLADALLKIDFAVPATERAAWSIATRQSTRSRDVSMAKALASEAAIKAARASIQVHGAIGYTWECDVQLFAKKAWALAGAYGDARFHRRCVSDAVLGSRN
jgi:alkylation response protein AidB-like acyl-CoA dehydrogenase